MSDYYPKRYYQGLTQTRKQKRLKEINTRKVKSWKSKSAYKPFETDKNVKTKVSGYTQRWKEKHPDSHSLKDASRISGVPFSIIKQVFNRGMAAWRTGHRPGATEQQWGYARVYSFLLKGKTYYTADADLARKLSS